MDLIIHLFRYKDLDDDQYLKRQEEIENCAFANYNHPYIKLMHVFVSPIDLEYFKELLPKADFIVSETIPTYTSFLEYASSALKRDAVVCIAKNDIEFGELKPKLLDALKRDEFYSLTSYGENIKSEGSNIPRYCYFNYDGKHDCFIFRNPIRINPKNVNYVQDRTNVENRLHLELKKNKYKILNPCTQLPVYHHREFILPQVKYDPICSQREIKISEVKPTILSFTMVNRTIGGRLKITSMAY